MLQGEERKRHFLGCHLGIRELFREKFSTPANTTPTYHPRTYSASGSYPPVHKSTLTQTLRTCGHTPMRVRLGYSLAPTQGRSRTCGRQQTHVSTHYHPHPHINQHIHPNITQTQAGSHTYSVACSNPVPPPPSPPN